MASTTQNNLLLILSLSHQRGAGPQQPLQGSPRGVHLHLCPSPREASASAGPGVGPLSPLRDTCRREIPRSWAHLAAPQPCSRPIPSLPRRKPVSSPVESPGAIPVQPTGRGPGCPCQTPSDAHSPSFSACLTRLGSCLGSRPAALAWPCGPMARPGRQARPPPSFRQSRGVPPQPRLHRLPHPRRPPQPLPRQQSAAVT